MINHLDNITPLILTLNEEANIGRLLDQLDWANEVVVVDSFSQDKTKEICGHHSNVRFLERTFDSHAAQWQFGLDEVNSDWVLALDADYFPTDKVMGEISGLAFDVNAYWAKFDYCIDGKKVKGSIYPPVQLLYCKRHAHYVNDGHTQRVVIDGNDDWLKHPLLHDDRKPFKHWLLSQDRYSDLEAKKLLNTDVKSLNFNERIRRLGWAAPWIVPLLVLFRGAVFSKAGWVYAAERAAAEWILAQKLWKLRVK